MKQFIKTVLALAIAAAMLPGLVSCGTKGPSAADTEVFERFMQAIVGGDYSAAYDCLSRECTQPKQEEGETVIGAEEEEEGAYISREDFTARYENIFGALGLNSVEYEKTGARTEEGESVIGYTATYHTTLAGDLVNEFEMTVVPEGEESRVLWAPSLIFPEMEQGDTVRLFRTAAKRGDIVASGDLLAETVTTWAVKAVKAEIKNAASFAEAAAEIIPIEAEEVLEKLNGSSSEKVLLYSCNEGGLSGDAREAIDALEGAELDMAYGTGRVYPQGDVMAHAVGYIGYASAEEAEKLNEGRTEMDGLYDEHSLVGKSGIEAAYETELRGRDGYSIVIRDSENVTKKTIFDRPVEHGCDVVLTVDLDLQKRAEQVFDLVLWGENTAGAAIAMDPKTGEIKAMVSYPSYDLNKLAVKADAEYYDTLMKMANKPMQNRATMGLYPPGSAIKPFTASAALELDYITPNYIFTGTIVDDYWTPTTYGRWVWPAIKRTKLKKRQEPMNLANCLLHSDNIYFANLALMMGEEDFLGYLRGIGFEQDFPFDLSVSKSTLKVRAESETEWNTRSIAETGYGQGQVTVTPLQLASIYCAFRNGGDIPVPRIADALYKTDGIEYTPVKEYESSTWIEGAIEESTIETLEPMMKDIMRSDLNGTGKKLKARGCVVAGKTGTAEIGSDKSREISWFVGYRTDVSAEDELLVLVVLEIPTTDEYKYLKFDIARELISTEPAAPLATEEPVETEAPAAEATDGAN